MYKFCFTENNKKGYMVHVHIGNGDVSNTVLTNPLELSYDELFKSDELVRHAHKEALRHAKDFCQQNGLDNAFAYIYSEDKILSECIFLFDKDQFGRIDYNNCQMVSGENVIKDFNASIDKCGNLYISPVTEKDDDEITYDIVGIYENKKKAVNVACGALILNRLLSIIYALTDNDIIRKIIEQLIIVSGCINVSGSLAWYKMNKLISEAEQQQQHTMK